MSKFRDQRGKYIHTYILYNIEIPHRLDIESQIKTQEETKNINVSLHTFGKVVMSLTSSGSYHIPYRDSKLTRILQGNLYSYKDII